MKAENRGNEGFLQRESVEHQGYAEARSTDRSEGKERDGASDLLEAILDRDNLNRAYKRVKSNHGAAGIDGMSVEEALPWLREHREELLQSIRDGSYEPSPVRRKEIPKPDGGVRKLGIPTVVDRVIQQGIAQKLQNIWEPQFSDSSYGYRPKRSGQQAIQKVKEYAEAGYRYAVSVDLSKYFDTLNHELLMNLLQHQLYTICEQSVVKLSMPHMPKFSRIHEKGTNFREALAKPISMVYDMSVRQSAVRIIMLIVHINILIALTA